MRSAKSSGKTAKKPQRSGKNQTVSELLESSDAAMIREAVLTRVTESQFEQWENHLAESFTANVKWWLDRIGGNRLAAGTVVTDIVAELIRAFECGQDSKSEEIAESL